MKRLACVAGILFLAGATPAFACPSPLTGKDAAGTTQNFGVTLDGSANCYGNIAIVDGSNAANKATVTAGNALKVDGSAVTQPISGTLTANQGTSPWVENVSQFGGSAVVTGTGASGAGIPRVTVSSDSNVLATQSGTWTVQQGGAPWSVSGTVTANQGTSPWVVSCSSGCTGGGGGGATTITNSAGQLLGGNIAGQNNIPFVVTPGATLASPLFPLPATQIWDGQHYLSLVAPNSLATQAQTAIVVRNPDAGYVADPVYAGTGSATQNAIEKGIYAAVTSSIPAGANTIGAVNQAGAPWGVSIQQGGNTAAVNASSQLSVNCANCSGSGVSQQDATGFSFGTTNMVPVGGAYSNAPTPLASGQAGVALLTQGRILEIARFDSAGRELGSSLPGRNNIGELVALAPQLSYSPTLYQSIDAQGRSNTSSMITDGQHYAGLTLPNTGATAAQTGLVVSVSPNSTATVAGTVTANAGSGTFTVGGTVTAAQATAANLNATVVGTGTFAVQAAQSGTWTVQQGTPPWQDNVTQFGSTNISTGTGASGAGIPRVTVSNDSNILATQSGAWTVAATESGTWTVQPGNTANTTPWLVSISQGGNTAAVNASSQLSVVCANCSGSGVSQQDLTGFTFGTTVMVPVGGVFSTTPSPIPSGQAGAARLTANRAIQQNQVDSAGRELGANLPGANNVAVQINQAAQLTQYNKTVFPTSADASGSLRTASVIYDGQHYADVVAANQVPGPTNGALVVVPSPKLSLQCPFTVGINQTASTQIATGQTGKFLHICGFGFVSATAQNVSLVEGTGSTCGTGTGALVGGTTASIAAAANGGLWNMTDRITIPMQKGGDNLCVLQSAAGNVSGTLTYGVF